MNRNDLEIFHKTNINPSVREFLWDNQEIPESLSAEVIKEVEERFNQDNWGLWKVINSSNSNYIGYVGLWCFFDEDQPQLLYALLPEHTGNGYATEASKAVVRYAFKQLGFNYLIAAMDKPNTGSVNVCKRLGMDFGEEKEVEGKPTLFFRLENKAV